MGPDLEQKVALGAYRLYEHLMPLIVQENIELRSRNVNPPLIFPKEFLFRTKEAQFEAFVWICAELLNRVMQDSAKKIAISRMLYTAACLQFYSKLPKKNKLLDNLLDKLNRRLWLYIPSTDATARKLCKLAYASSVFTISSAFEGDCNDGKAVRFFPKRVSREDRLMSNTIQKEPELLFDYVEIWVVKVRESWELKWCEDLIASVANELAGK